MERAFTMLKAGISAYDRYIDIKDSVRTDFLNKLGVSDKWGAEKAAECFRELIFDKNNQSSVRYSLERAYDNGIVLREEISTEALSQIQLAMDITDRAEKSDKSPAYTMLDLEDRIFAFWGCINDYVYDEEVLNIIECGKYLERLDMYTRLEYPAYHIKIEFDRLCGVLRIFSKDTPYRYNTRQLSVLVENFDSESDYTDNKDECLESLSRIFEVNR